MRRHHLAPMVPQKSSPATPKTIPNQVAVRYRAGQAEKVRERLATLGRMEDHPLSRILILHRAPSVTRRAVNTALKVLQDEKLVDFATPVLRDSASGMRKVLTDEIVLRLKSSRGQQRTLATLKGEHGLKIGRRNEFEPAQYIVRVSQASGTHTLDVARALDQRADVEFASPNFLTGIKRYSQ
jgi:S-adenosylmethionine:tRNA-ribosyltransferase-isomerase (queuine synthetase)